MYIVEIAACFQNLEEMITALQTQVSSLKHHNAVLLQLLDLHKNTNAVAASAKYEPLRLEDSNITDSLTASTKSILGYLTCDKNDDVVKLGGGPCSAGGGQQFLPLEPEPDFSPPPPQRTARGKKLPVSLL